MNTKTIAIKQEHKDWHTFSIEKTYQELNSSITGLSQEEARIRLTTYGPNELGGEQKESAILLLLGQFKSMLIIILLIAACISYYSGDILEAFAIITIVLLAGVLGFIQEFQAGKAIESLKKMASPRAHVIRDDEESEINSSDLVPGDIMLLKTGDKIAADARIIEARNLRIEESSLTGESIAVEKNITTIESSLAALGDRLNLVFMGTSISYGRGKAIVVATGHASEFGKIAYLLQNTENRKTPLQNNLNELGKKLGVFSIVLAIGMALIGVWRGQEIAKMFTWGVALAVAVIPEALPAVVTISLALGVRRMVKRKALVRKLTAVETLGATNIICSDKTGTLTQDAMTIRKIFAAGKTIDVTGGGYKPKGEFQIEGKTINPNDETTMMELLRCSVLCSDTKLKMMDNGDWVILGDPTEGAFVVAAIKAGLDDEKLRLNNPRVDEIPFSSETKRMTTVHIVNEKTEVYSKGAVEVLLGSCGYILENGIVREITEADIDTFTRISLEFSDNALRVIAVTKKDFDSKKETLADAEKGMTFIGLVGMFDPPRLEVKTAIDTCFQAGIRPIMITGDHKATAVAIARELGILKKENALSGAELEVMSEREFQNAIHDTVVYARISPEHKLKIVEALMNQGNIVAMTGDGVNDAPSLKKADIGVAMGITGTDVSKEAADMILTDDNFASIVSAIEEGRSIFENIRKYLLFLLSGNMGTVFALIFTLMATLPIPLNAVQILFINFIMDGLIAIALGVEPPEPGIMNRKPRNVREGILNRDTLIYVGFIGGLIAFVTVGVYVWGMFSIKGHDAESKTMFFYTLIFARLFNGFNCRSLDQSVFKMKFWSNKLLVASALISIVFSVALLSTATLQKAFDVVPLSSVEWTALLISSMFVLLVVELWKMLMRSHTNL